MTQPQESLIVALDVSNAADAQRIVGQVGRLAGFYKVGKQLFTAEGPQVVRDLAGSGHRVFLDLKYHDIPNTVGKAVAEACRLGISMLNVHASGGSRMLKAAVEAVANSNCKPLLLAVTVLTSLNDEDMQEIGVVGRTIDQVLRMANLARDCGCGGVVASPREIRQLRQAMGTGFAIVTPGVRPAGSDKGDQERSATPAEAISAGASHIVVGRPITAAPDPAEAARRILDEISQPAVASR